MKTVPSPAKLLREVIWRRLDEVAFEHCRCLQTSGGYSLSGVVLTVVGSDPLQVHYLIDCGVDWVTRDVTVHTIQGDTTRNLHLQRDHTGSWWRDGERTSRFDGLTDIDLSVSPATNTLPIRRMDLAVGASAPTEAVWVRFPDLTLERLSQRYLRRGPLAYAYESRAGRFKATLEVDDEGLIVRYGNIWERVAP